MHLIGINGFKRSGKGEVGKAIESQYLGHVKQVGFADKLKIMAAKALGLNGTDQELIELMDEFKESGVIDASWGYEPNGTHITGRQYLQHFGNQARVVFGENFWVDQVLPDPFMQEGWLDCAVALSSRYPDVDILCITDLRYENEAQRVKRLGGVVWEVIRPGLTSDGHDSEQPLPRELIDAQIHNDSSLRDLGWEVDKQLELMLYG